MNECSGREVYIWMIFKTEYGTTLRLRQKNKREWDKRKVLLLSWRETNVGGGDCYGCIYV